MSLAALSWAFSQCEAVDLSDGEKLLLLAIADMANQDGECWPGVDNLARKCGRSERTIRQRLSMLEDKGLFTRTQRRRDNGSLSSNLYRLAMPLEDGTPTRATGKDWRLYIASGGGRLKVGISAEPGKRVKELGLAVGIDLALLYDRSGTRGDEAALHAAAAEWRMYGEWYEDCDEVRAALRKCLQTTVGTPIADGDTGSGPEPEGSTTTTSSLGPRRKKALGGPNRRRGRERSELAEVDGVAVTNAERELSAEVLGIFNEVFAKNFSAVEYRRSIIMRIRSHPELTPDGYRELVAKAKRNPWWRDSPTPAVVFGNGRVFDALLNADPDEAGVHRGRRGGVTVDQMRALAERLREEGR